MKHSHKVMMNSLVLLLLTVPLVFTQEGNNDMQETPTSNEHKESSILLLNTDRLQKQSRFECEGPWRLPKNILPTNYDITLRLDPEEPVFNGSVSIDIQCVTETDKIIFHARNLTISSSSISVWKEFGVGDPITISNITFDEEHEMVHLKLGSSLRKGSYVLTVAPFTGYFQNDTSGVFLKTYNIEQTTRKLIASQLQDTYARVVFPCFDEPNMKATFTINIERPSEYKSFSSMPLARSTQQSYGRVLDTFERTVVLPVYAIGFLIGDYSMYPMNEVQKINYDDRTHILVPDGDLNKVKFAFELAVKSLTKLESYTKIPYPVSKIDHVAVPDFSPEAMENWGFIPYQKYFIVDDPKIHTGLKQGGLALIAHELAHQWFGNMVTAEWWSYLWLNEAFATYLQFVITNEILPQWQLWDQFIVERLQYALTADAAKKDPKPAMTSRRCTITDIAEAFDEITYNKGACILRMFEFILGADVFQGGLRLYLQRRSMQNARPSDLFKVFDEISAHLNEGPLPKNVTFTDLATAWTEQAGFPLITVTRDYSSSSVYIKQERFFDQRAKNISVENQSNRWWVPLTWNSAASQRLSSARGAQDWLYEDKTIRVNASPNNWLLFNIDATGFYRVNYDYQNWDLLRKKLERNPSAFSVSNRIQLVNDAFTLGFAHRLSLGTALNMTRYLRGEENPVAWISAIKQFENLHEIFASSPEYPKLENYLQKLMRNVYRKIRLDIAADYPYTHMNKILQADLAPAACSFGLDVCLIDARFALVQFLAEAKLKGEKSAVANLHEDIQIAVLCGGVRSGGRSLFEEVRSLALNTSIDSMKTYYRMALCCTNDFNLLTWHLADIFDNNTLLSDKDAFDAVEVVLQHQHTLYTGYQFVKNNINKINHFYNSSTNYTENLAKEIIKNIRTHTFYDEVRQWIVSSTGNELGNNTELLRHIESRKPEVEWSTESLQQISDWLNTPHIVLPEPMIVSEGTISARSSLSVVIVSLIVYLTASL